MARQRRSLIFGRLVITTVAQVAGAPAIDRATIVDEEGRNYWGRAILLLPWRRRTDATIRTPTLVVGWRRG